MKAKVQHSESVEISVMRSLHSTLNPDLPIGDVFSLAKREFNPKEYISPGAFKRDYVLYSFLRKWKGFVGQKPADVALRSWLEAEKLCFQTNRRLDLEATTGSYSVAPSIISDAQRKILQILGRLDYESIARMCRFGPGATCDLRRGSSHAKKSIRPSITFDAIPYACRVLARDEYLGSLVGPLRDLKIRRANRMVMVPKTFKTDRPIAAEPTLNSFIQQGIGRTIRQKLKRFGVDLDDQTINQDLARYAQNFGLSTIDLSMASDTLCTNLVKLLLPPEWYDLLSGTRCSHTTYKGRDFLLSKFSSMGNAYTFELESLIFYALVSSACSAGVTSVYGDDIVIIDTDYRPVVEVLRWAGFVVNEEKSFTEGSRFFESCGKHFFDGEEVTPCYQKDVCSRPHDFVRLHNRLVRAGIRLGLRNEFAAAASIVRERSRAAFGARSPGIGPQVEYDEYFIKEDFAWPDPYADRVQIRSAVTLAPSKRKGAKGFHIAYLARKLRCPEFLSPDREGQVAETLRPKLLVTKKYHWRSSEKSGCGSDVK